MTRAFLKGLKPLLMKRLALLMGICYLASPLQQQITSVFHSVSHVLETPDYVMGHSSKAQNDTLHTHNEHSSHVYQHNHSLIDFIDSIWEASDHSEHDENSILADIKVDKHLTTYQFEIVKTFITKTTHQFWGGREKQKKGYFENLKKPPQFFISLSDNFLRK